jgi:hypothetical protein
MMMDYRWQEVYQALRHFIRLDDIVLMPFGDWPDLSCKVYFYDDIINIEDATVLVLHKGRFGSIDKAALRTVSDKWQCILGNDVFLCFSKDFRAHRDIRQSRNRIHYGVLHRFLQSRQLRRRTSRVWYVHLPKAAGTWMWQLLSQAYPSRLYYPSFTAFVANPPDIDEYDLIGGHLPLSTISKYLSPEDHVIGLMREPTERLLSAFLHSRRPTEDPSTFTATMRAMRDMPFREFIQTESGRLEAQQQLIMLGCDYAIGQSSSDDQIYLDRAQTIISADQFLFAPCPRSAEFFRMTAQLCAIKKKYSGETNENDYSLRLPDVSEFNVSLDQLRSLNVKERQLYDFVSTKFATVGDDAYRRPARLRLWYRTVKGSLQAMGSKRFSPG